VHQPTSLTDTHEPRTEPVSRTAERFARYAFHDWDPPHGDALLARSIDRATSARRGDAPDIDVAYEWLRDVLAVAWVDTAMLLEEGFPAALVDRLRQPHAATARFESPVDQHLWQASAR
jgi:hypothetical protein